MTRNIIYRVDGEDFVHPGQASARLERIWGFRIKSVDWLNITSIQDQAEGREVYTPGTADRLDGKLA